MLSPMLAALLTTVFFSLSAITGNRCARMIGGLEANFWRLSIATFLLGLYAHHFGEHLFGAAFPAFLVSGLVGVGLGDMAFFQALPRIGSRLTVLLIQCLSVPVAAMVEWFWMGTSLSLGQMLSGFVILAGIAMAMLAQGKLQLHKGEVLSGTCFAVLAALANGMGAVLSRKAYSLSKLAGQNIDGFTAAYERILGGLMVAAIVILIVKWRATTFSASKEVTAAGLKAKWKPVWPWLVGTSLAGQTFGVSCFQWALKHYPTGVVLPIVAMTPLVTIPFSWYAEGERPCLRSILGAAIAVAGVVVLLTLK